MPLFGLSKIAISQIIEVFTQYPEVEKAILYGSRAKGNYRHGSDIDLTLIGSNIDLNVLNRISLALDDLLLPYEIDISIYKHIDNEQLVQHIERVGKTFYARNLKTAS
jgi:predicted nucleotidyltransferase